MDHINPVGIGIGKKNGDPVEDEDDGPCHAGVVMDTDSKGTPRIRVILPNITYTFDTSKCDRHKQAELLSDVTLMMKENMPMGMIIGNMFTEHGINCTIHDKKKTKAPPCPDFSSDVSREDFSKDVGGCLGAELTSYEKLQLMFADYELRFIKNPNSWAKTHDRILECRDGQYPRDWHYYVVQENIWRLGQAQRLAREVREKGDPYCTPNIERVTELARFLETMESEPVQMQMRRVEKQREKVERVDIEASLETSLEDVSKLAHTRGIKILKAENPSRGFSSAFRVEVGEDALPLITRLFLYFRSKIYKSDTLNDCLSIAKLASITFGKIGFHMPYQVAQEGFNFEDCNRDDFVAKTMRIDVLPSAYIDFNILEGVDPSQPEGISLKFRLVGPILEHLLQSTLKKRNKLLISKFKTELLSMMDVEANLEADSSMKSVIEAEEAIKTKEERKKSAEYQEEVRQRNAKARAKEKERAEERKKRLEEEAKMKAKAEEQAKREAQQLAANAAIQKAIELANKAFADGNSEDAKNRLRVATTKHAPNATDEVRASLKAAKEELFPCKKAEKKNDVQEPPSEPAPPMIDAVKKESNSQRKARRKREKEAEEAVQAQAKTKEEAERKATEEKEKEAIETQKRLMLEFEAAKRGNGGKGGKGRGGRDGRGGRSSERGSGCASSQTPSSSSQDKLCVVCMDADSTHVNVPCGHACLCQNCAELLDSKKIRECPTCRGPVSMRMRVFF